MINIKSCVIQEDKNGCQIACIATVLQKPYKEIEKHFITDLETTGISPMLSADYLAGFGLDIIWKESCYFGTGYDIQNQRMLVPFADIHIVSIEQFIEKDGKGNPVRHALIMNKFGKLFCPSDGKLFEKDYLSAIGLLGIYYPKNWKFKKEKRR